MVQAKAFWNTADLIKASAKYTYTPENGFPRAGDYKSYCFEDASRGMVEGFNTEMSCRPEVCLPEPKQCRVIFDNTAPNYFFDPEEAFDPNSGCCLTADGNCTEENQCGEQCFLPPDSCFVTDPTSPEPCITSDCYSCNNSTNGTALYVLGDLITNAVCISTGNAKTDDGQDYKWAIICGEQTSAFPGHVEENRDFGEVDCIALRQGADFTDDNKGIWAGALPCQYLQLAECGCAPPDVFEFDQPKPTAPCLTKDDCPILCSDVPDELPNLCDSFPGDGVDWWDNKVENPFNKSMFSVEEFPGGVPEDFEIIVNNCHRLWLESIPILGWLFVLIFGFADFIVGLFF